MKKEKKENKFIKSPSFKGGMKALRKFVSANLKYPKTALENKIKGTVHLRYSIDRTGKTFNVKVIKGIGSGCNEEAQRIVGLLNFEMPKNRAGKLIFHKTLQIHFRLPKETETKKINIAPPVEQVITYSYTTSTDKSNTDNGNYGYSISIKK
jgi:TonB family protein